METKRKKFTTSMDETVIDAVKIQAIVEKRSVGEILEELIRRYLETAAPRPAPEK